MRLTTFAHLRFTLHHLVTLYICTFQFVLYSVILISAPEMHKLISMCPWPRHILMPGAHWDAGRRRVVHSRPGRRRTRNTAKRSASAHWDVVSCSLAKWAMADLIALSSESESDEERDTLMLLHLTSKLTSSRLQVFLDKQIEFQEGNTKDFIRRTHPILLNPHPTNAINGCSAAI